MNAIETKGLTKIFESSFGRKKVAALVDFNLQLPQGMIFGLLGPNGAGKTTLIKLLLRIAFPTAGSASLLGEDISNYKIKSKIGYLPENHHYPGYLTGGAVLNFFGRLSGLEGKTLEKKIDELLEMVKLSKWKKAKVKTYSKGMMQRLGLAQSIINDPSLIFLDEPTDGVDPIGRKEIRDILTELKSRNKTIFLNSHLLSEVELITDKVAILNKGRVLREGSVSELTEKKEEYIINAEGNNLENIIAGVRNNISLTKINNGSFSVKVNDAAELNNLIDHLRKNGIMLKEIHQQKSSLEEMFISLINEAEKREQL